MCVCGEGGWEWAGGLKTQGDENEGTVTSLVGRRGVSGVRGEGRGDIMMPHTGGTVASPVQRKQEKASGSFHCYTTRIAMHAAAREARLDTTGETFGEFILSHVS